MTKFFAFIFCLISFLSVQAETVLGSLPAEKPPVAEFPLTDILKIESNDFYVVDSAQPNTAQVTIEAKCSIQNCQFELELTDANNFVIISNESGDTSLGKTAKITFICPTTSPGLNVTALTAEFTVYTTNLEQNFSMKKSIQFFLYK